MGLAIAAAVNGYRCIFTTTDKQSKEKVDALKAFGAEVIVCPTDVGPEEPRIDWLGALTTGYGNRPYTGNTGYVRLLYRF
jgi:cysteine synthase